MMEFALWSSSLPTHRSQEDCANPVMTVVFQLGKCSRTPQLFCPRDCGVSEPTLLSLQSWPSIDYKPRCPHSTHSASPGLGSEP